MSKNDGLVYLKQIAKIESTHLGYEDHGILTAHLYVDYGGSHQGIGGYALDGPVRDDQGKFLRREGTAFGMKWIQGVLDACGVDRWEKLVGRTIYVLKIGNEWTGEIVGIEALPFDKGKRFLFSDLTVDKGEVK